MGERTVGAIHGGISRSELRGHGRRKLGVYVLWNVDEHLKGLVHVPQLSWDALYDYNCLIGPGHRIGPPPREPSSLVGRINKSSLSKKPPVENTSEAAP